MHCPFCQASDTKVIDSRLAVDGDQVRRRRECIDCQERFTTYEVVELSLPRLMKQNGEYEQFKEIKLRASILRALDKRSVSTDAIDQIVKRIIQQLQASGDREVETSLIGEWVMKELRSIDQVAYVRFASVYKKFQDIEEFQREISQMQKAARAQ